MPIPKDKVIFTPFEEFTEEDLNVYDSLKKWEELIISTHERGSELMEKYFEDWKASGSPVYHIGFGYDEKGEVIELAHGINRDEVVKIMKELGYPMDSNIPEKVTYILTLKDYIEILNVAS